MPASIRLPWFAAAYTLFLSVAALWQCDQVIRQSERHADAAPVAAVSAPDPAPLFVIFVDSLRYETAMDETIMPALAALRHQGPSAKMNTTYQAHTVPSLRAIFTGGSSSGVFNVITDFRRSNLRLASLFSELRASGRASASWSSGQFNQFGDTLEHRFVPSLPGAGAGGDPMLNRDQRRIAAALELFATGRHALVIAHIEFTDYAGHEFGIYRPDYRRYFSAADALVAEAVRRLPANASLAVLGDHGHDERGAHKAGLDIPTVAVFRGPAFRAGFNLGTIEITEVGYFLHAALRQPLNRAAFAQAALNPALEPGAEPPALRTFSATAATPQLPFLVPIAFVLLAAAAWRLWRGSEATVQTLAWTALAATLVPGIAGPTLAAALALAALLVRPIGKESLVAVTVGTALVLFGLQLRHAPGSPPLGPWVAGALIATAAIATCRRPLAERPIWLAGVAAATVWLAEPWQHAAGWLAATLFAGLGLIWLVAAPARRAPWTIAAVALLSLTFASFYRLDSTGHWAFATPKSLGAIVPFAIAAGAAKLFLLRRFAPANRLGFAVALIAAVLLGLEQWGVDRSVFDWHERVAATGLVALFGGAWLIARCKGAQTWTPLLGVAALFALFYHGVRAQPFHHAWTDLLFAGFFLAGTLAPDARARAWLGAGVVALSFTLVQGWLPGGVEWQAIYDWFPAEMVEAHVGWFIPWILFRETLPLWIGRQIIVRAGAPDAKWPGAAVAQLVGAWVVGLVLVRIGHFATAPTIETLQIPAEQLAGLGVLLGAALTCRTRRYPPTRDTPPAPAVA